MSYLETENADTASSLHQDSLTGLQWLQTVQGIPGSQTSTGQGCGFDCIKVLGGKGKTLLVEGTVLAQGAIVNTTKTGLGGLEINFAVEMSLVEQSDDLIALLESRNLGTDLDDSSCTIRARDNREIEWEGVFSL